MKTLCNLLQTMWLDQEGLTSVEYGLLLALLFLAGLAGWQQLGGSKMALTAGSVSRYMGGS